MRDLNKISEDLFNKIRSRFPSVTIGDSDGSVINDPQKARFFDFDYVDNGKSLGKISMSVSEDTGLTVIYTKDFIQNEDESVQSNWYNFLKELRVFSKKRLLNFDVRDINKSNLNKRDFKFLASNRRGDDTMNESTLYGKNKVSYQKIDNARLVIKHNESVNPEIPGSRTRHIKSIYIESTEGERFKYPFKHLSGARAMARHVSEGGNQYDDFGKHIIGLSEELSKLRKFKTYMGRSSVMAESLAGYMDVVKERIAEVKKTIHNLQKPTAYKEAVESFEAAVYEDVPDDVAENWIDQLTIKQFNEELKDVFPYIYRLVSEATKAKALGPEDLDEAGKLKGGAKDPCWSGYQMVGTKKKGGREVPNCVPREEIELESGFERMMGQFGEAENNIAVSWMEKHDPYIEYHINAANNALRAGNKEEQEKHKDIARAHRKAQIQWEMNRNDGQAETMSRKAIQASKETGADIGEEEVNEAYIDNAKDAIEVLGNLRRIGKSIERGQGTYDGNLAGEYANDVYDVISWLQNNADTSDPKFKQVIDPVIELRKKAKSMEREPGSGKDARFGNEIVNTLYPLMQWIQMNAQGAKEGNAFAHAVRQAKMNGKKKGDTVQGPDGKEITLEKQKTPLGEFILSYFDRNTGQFPKGETAVLTMIEKDYGEEFIEPAKAFIEQVNNLVAERFGFREPDIQEDNYELNDISRLAGL